MKLRGIARFLLGVGTGLIVFMGTEVRAEGWRPRSSAYQLRESREECSVYKSVLTSTRDTLSRKQGDVKALSESTQQYFKSLNECREKNGLKPIENPDSDPKTAELCEEPYNLWLMEGTYLMAVEEEINKLRDEVGTLAGAVSRKCERLVVAQVR